MTDSTSSLIERTKAQASSSETKIERSEWRFLTGRFNIPWFTTIYHTKVDWSKWVESRNGPDDGRKNFPERWPRRERVKKTGEIIRAGVSSIWSFNTSRPLKNSGKMSKTVKIKDERMRGEAPSAVPGDSGSCETRRVKYWNLEKLPDGMHLTHNHNLSLSRSFSESRSFPSIKNRFIDGASVVLSQSALCEVLTWWQVAFQSFTQGGNVHEISVLSCHCRISIANEASEPKL
jgi:hypothetical protein